MKRKFTIILGIVFSVLLIGGVAYASIPGPDGVIHGCYKTSNPGQGAVIVVDHTVTCPPGFAPLNWNQTGPQGPAGINGTNGTNGVSGWEWIRGLDTMVSISPETFGHAITYCPFGKKPLGGGYNTDSPVRVNTNFPYIAGPGGDGWYVEGYNSDTINNHFLSAWVICATVS